MTLTNHDLMAISQLFDVKMGAALEPVMDEIFGLKQQNACMGEDIQGLKQQSASMREDIQGLKQQSASMSEEIQDLKQQSACMREDIQDLKQQSASMREDIQDLKQQSTRMSEDIQDLKQQSACMSEEIQDLKHHTYQLEEKLPSIEGEICGLKLHMENVIEKNIQLLAENYVPAAKRYEEAVPKIEIIEADIDIMKKVIMEHSRKLRALA